MTRTLVAADDPGFTRPTKPIGRFVGEAEAQTMIEHGELWEDRGDKGWRRMVASPEPVEILDAPAVLALIEAGFVVVAVLLRPVGGWLSDRFGAVPVLATSYAVVVVGAAVSAGTPPLEGIGTAAFLAMAAALGAGSGATFALIAAVTEPSRVGGVTGLVGAAGGLGGFVPPLVMGFVYGRTESYAIGLWMLSVTAALTLVLTLTLVRRTERAHDAAAEATSTTDVRTTT